MADKYYDDATLGNDGGTGEIGDPWKTVNKVNISAFNAGDIIYFKCGEIWRELLTCDQAGVPGNPVTYSNYGEGDNPLIIGSDDYDVVGSWTGIGGNKWATANATFAGDPQQVLYDTNSIPVRGLKQALEVNLDANWEWWWDDPNDRVVIYHDVGNPANQTDGLEIAKRVCINITTDYNTIDGIDVKFALYYGIRAITVAEPVAKNLSTTYASREGVLIDTCTDILMDNITASYNFATGLWAKDCIAGIISNCDSGYNNTEPDSGGAHSINLEASSNLTIEYNKCHHSGRYSGIGGDQYSYCTIQYNEVYNNTYHGIDMSGTDVHCEYNIARYNLIYNNTGEVTCCGITIYAHDIVDYESHHNEVYYNILYGNTLGIRIMGHANDNEVYNNVLYENGIGIATNQEISIYPQGAANPNGNTIKNNIVYRTNGRMAECRIAGENNTFDYNCYYPESDNCFRWVATAYDTLAEWQVASGQDANSINTNPLFIDAPNHNFHLLRLSPCRDAGEDVGLTQDYDAVPVPQETNPAIGAFEWREPPTRDFLPKICYELCCLLHYEAKMGLAHAALAADMTLYGWDWTENHVTALLTGRAEMSSGHREFIRRYLLTRYQEATLL